MCLMPGSVLSCVCMCAPLSVCGVAALLPPFSHFTRVGSNHICVVSTARAHGPAMCNWEGERFCGRKCVCVCVRVSVQDSASRRAAMRNNPYNLGPARNWREAFHVNGHKLWYLTWCLPSRIPRQGRPWELPRRAGHRITFADGSV